MKIIAPSFITFLKVTGVLILITIFVLLSLVLFIPSLGHSWKLMGIAIILNNKYIGSTEA